MLFLFLNIFFFLDWRIIALQCCVGCTYAFYLLTSLLGHELSRAERIRRMKTQCCCSQNKDMGLVCKPLGAAGSGQLEEKLLPFFLFLAVMEGMAGRDGAAGPGSSYVLVLKIGRECTYGILHSFLGRLLCHILCKQPEE